MNEAPNMTDIDPKMLKQLKAMWSIGKASPTKKYRTRAQRMAMRAIQKASRRKNRGQPKRRAIKKANGHRCGFK